MEEEKKQAATDIISVQQEIRSSAKSDLEILNSARLGTSDYDFDSVKIIKEGVVFEITSKIDGKTYAAKRLEYRIGSKNNKTETIATAEREISCLRALDHPMIVEILDLVKDDDNYPFIIMEKCNQSLGNIIRGCKEEIPEKRVLRIFTMICIPLYYIHSKKITHRDLKPDNFLQKFIGNQEMFLLADFGTSFMPGSEYLETVKQNMTLLYAPIEQVALQDAQQSFDIWSLGITLYALMARKEPYQLPLEAKFKAMQENNREQLPDDYSEGLRNLVDYLLEYDQSKRPTIEQVLLQPIVRDELESIMNDFRPLTLDKSTAGSAHKVLEQIELIKQDQRLYLALDDVTKLQLELKSQNRQHEEEILAITAQKDRGIQELRDAKDSELVGLKVLLNQNEQTIVKLNEKIEQIQEVNYDQEDQINHLQRMNDELRAKYNEPEPDQFLLNSKCTTDKKKKEYLNQLLGNKRLVTYLLFRGSEHGWNYKDFHSRRYKKFPTISLFKIKDGDCIGGFTTAQWEDVDPGKFVPDSQSFLFNLSSCRLFKGSNEAGIHCYTNQGPRFTSTSNVSELTVSNEPFNGDHKCKSWPKGAGYNIGVDADGKNMLTNQKHEFFTISELEIWRVVNVEDLVLPVQVLPVQAKEVKQKGCENQ